MDLQGYGWQLVDGAGLTILVAAISFVFGSLVGFIGAGAKLAQALVWRVVADTYTTIIRGIPDLIIILLLYFGGTVTLTAVAGHYVEVNGFSAGVFALSLVFGAYATEVFRGAILAVPRGQIEAARALGLHRAPLFFKVMLPQIWRFALPGLGNLWMGLLKNTSLISVVGLDELMRATYVAAGVTRKPFTFYVTAAFMYLAFTLISEVALQHAERRVNRGFGRA